MQESLPPSSSSSSVSTDSTPFCGVALATPAGYSVNVRCPMLATRLQAVANLIENPRDSVSLLAEEIVVMLDEQFRDRKEVRDIGQEIAERASVGATRNERFYI